MTVSYNFTVSNSGLLTWIRLTFKWKGSIWKSVWAELAFWLILYYAVLLLYHLGLSGDHQRHFDEFATYLNTNVERLPLIFMLGFFVTFVVNRWEKIYQNLGWIEDTALLISTLVHGDDEETILARRAIVRYICVGQLMVFRDISIRCRRRFPTMESLVDAGYLEKAELHEIESFPMKFNKYWLPFNWSLAIIYQQRVREKIPGDPSLQSCVQEVKRFRDNMQWLSNYDWVPIPLAYPQVVFFAVRVYFYLCLIGRQFIISTQQDQYLNIWFPLTTCLQFVFYIGWMKVAETLLNPMGEDDDDFETTYLVDKNIATAMAIVDDTSQKHPPLIKDRFKNIRNAQIAIDGFDEDPVGTLAHLKLPDQNDKHFSSRLDSLRASLRSLTHKIHSGSEQNTNKLDSPLPI
ncbi:unnamed protein product, partial [Mesorhabditis belari]|uniref:Bestrophin homolog n=1 Tax=Mesorhabditis belari TaxID=2138241 RepID=A0AAF3EPR6_9BILA